MERQSNFVFGGHWGKKFIGGFALCAVLTGFAWVASSAYTEKMLHSAYEQQLKEGNEQLESLSESIEDALSTVSGIPVVLAHDEMVRRELAAFGPGRQASSSSREQNKERWENIPSLKQLSQRFQRVANNLRADVVWALNSAGECIAASNSGTPLSFIGGNYSDRLVS